MDAEVISTDQADNEMDAPDQELLSWLCVQGPEPLILPSVEPVLPPKKVEPEINAPDIGMQHEEVINTQHKVVINIQPEATDVTQHEVVTNTQSEVANDTQDEVVINTQPEAATDNQHEVVSNTHHEAANDTQHEAANDTQHKVVINMEPEAAPDIHHEVVMNTQPEAIMDTQPGAIMDTRPEVVIYTQPEVANDTQHEVVIDTRPEAATDTQPEASTGTQHEVVIYTQPEAATDTQHEVVIDTQPEVVIYTQSEAATDTQHESVINTQLEAATDTQCDGATDMRQEAGSSTQQEVISSQSIGPYSAAAGIDQMTLQKDPLPTVGVMKNGVIIELYLYITQTMHSSQRALASTVVLLSGCSTVKAHNVSALISKLLTAYRKARKGLRGDRRLREMEQFLDKEFLLIRSRGKKTPDTQKKHRQRETVSTSVNESKGEKRKLDSQETCLSELEMTAVEKDALEERTVEEKDGLEEKTAEENDALEERTMEEEDALEERLVRGEAEREAAESEELALQTQCKELQGSQHSLLMNLRAITEKFDPAKEEFAKYKQRYADTKKQLQATQEKLVGVQSRVKHSEHRNLHKKLKHSDESLESIQAEATRTQETIIELKEEIKTTTAQLEVCRKSLMDLETKCETLKAGKRNQDQKLRTLKEKLESMIRNKPTNWT